MTLSEQVIADLALSSEFGKSNANLGAVLLSWGAGPKSSMFDLHVQLFVPVHTAIHITGKGGGVVSNTWGALIPSCGLDVLLKLNRCFRCLDLSIRLL